MNVPSYSVFVGDKVGVREASKGKAPFQRAGEDEQAQQVPLWLTFDEKMKDGKIIHHKKRYVIYHALEKKSHRVKLKEKDYFL